MTKPTTFSKWREELQLSIAEAGELLGLGPHQIQFLLRGYDGVGRPAVPSKGARLLMAAAKAGIRLQPVEINEEERAAVRAASIRRAAGRPKRAA